MSLRLVLGRAGSGKTELCMQEIKAAYAKRPMGQFLLIAPEQASFISEKRLLRTLDGKGGFNVKVLSFRRFVWTVLQVTGGGLKTPLDKVGKSLIIRSLLERYKDQLKNYQQVYQVTGFVDQLCSLMDELRSYSLQPEDLNQCLGNIDDKANSFYKKIEDLQMIYQSYCEELAGDWLDGPGELALLCQKLNKWPDLEQTEYWLDGFHGFTPAEYQVILQLLKADRPITITLNLPAGSEISEMSEEEVFFPPWETAQDLQTLCYKHGIKMEATVYLDEPSNLRFVKNPTLAWLEEVMAQPNKKKIYSEQVQGISIQGYGNLQQEVEGLANQILQTVQRLDCRFQDFTVLIRQPEVYEGVIRSVFAAYEIPYFFDSPKSMSFHPLVNLFRTTLSFIEGHWNHSEIFAYVKTGMTGINMSQGDRLENYCLAHGIRRAHWQSKHPWQFTKTEIDLDMEALRQKIWLPLANLQEKINNAPTLRDMITALYEHFVEIKVEQQCRRLAIIARQKGQVELALIHEKAWQDILQLIDQVVKFLGEQKLSRKSLVKILHAGLEAMETLIVPPTLDQVTVSSMDRSRTSQVKLVWILGINEGILPARINDNSLLSNRERIWLNEHDIKLAPNADKRLFSESYLIYIALTRASEELHLSFARADHEGKGLAASTLLYRLCRLLPGLEIEDCNLPAEALITVAKPTLQRLSAVLQNPYLDKSEIGLWRYVYAWFNQRESWQWDLMRINQGLNLRPLSPTIPEELSKALFGRSLNTSVTRLEKFQACPFAHFMAYGLGLKVREEYEVRPPEIGNLFHDSLEELIKAIKQEGKDLASLTNEELDRRIENTIENQLNREQHSIFLSSAWYKTLSRNLSRIIKRSALVLAEHERRGEFRPYALELGFGTGEPDSLEPLTLQLNDGSLINLRGRIDRIDIAKTANDSNYYLRILDYKSGYKTLSLWEIYYGLKIQLILYLEVALKALSETYQVKPAGVFYFQVADPILKLNNNLQISNQNKQELLLKALKLRGYALADQEVIRMMDNQIQRDSNIIPVAILNSGEFDSRSLLCSEEEFSKLQSYSKTILTQAAQRMLAGEVAIKPYRAGNNSSCDYCEFSSICRFDPTIQGHQFRELKRIKDQEVWQILKHGGDSNETLE